MSKQRETARHYRRLIKNCRADRKAALRAVHIDAPCAGCEYYQPFFKYRRCLYTNCPYQKVDDVFRRKPLDEDIIAQRTFEAIKKMQVYQQDPEKCIEGR